MPDSRPVEPSLQDFINAVEAEALNVSGKSKEEALQMLQEAANRVGSGATVTYSTDPDPITGEGAVIVTFNEVSSDPIDVDIIA